MDSGSLTWVLVSAALVLFMTPGLAFFYGGMDRSRNVLNMLMMNFYCILIVPVLWMAVGYSLAQGGTGDFIGYFDFLFLKDIGILEDNGGQIATIAFLGMFACITPALISGAVADRMKFSAWALFVPAWLLLVFVPVFKWIYGGWLGDRGSLDFAGGTVVHINAGIAGLVCAIVLGKRLGLGKEVLAPHNLPFAMIGACLLWVGWFGFNAGSNLEANGLTAQVIFNTILAASAAALSWTAGEWVTRGHPSLLGAVTGAVAGLVAITPACGWVSPTAALIIGLLSGIICLWAVVWLKAKLGYDDALDVFGVHGIGGILGALLTGYFVNPGIGGVGVTDYLATDTSVKALEYSFSAQMTAQIFGVLTAIILSAVVSYVALMICKYTTGLRVEEAEEREGLDIGSHGERAYS